VVTCGKLLLNAGCPCCQVSPSCDPLFIIRLGYSKVIQAAIMTMTRTIIIQALLLVLLMGGTAHGFVAPSSRSASSTTQLQIFGWGSRGDDKEKTPKAGPKNVKKEEKKKEPFVFMIGKPQYDWATGKRSYTSNKKRHNWVVKPEDYKPKK
jgi:hypothetical protein